MKKMSSNKKKEGDIKMEPKPIFIFADDMKTSISLQQVIDKNRDGTNIIGFVLDLYEILADYGKEYVPEELLIYAKKGMRYFQLNVREDEIIPPKNPNFPIWRYKRNIYGIRWVKVKKKG